MGRAGREAVVDDSTRRGHDHAGPPSGHPPRRPAAGAPARHLGRGGSDARAGHRRVDGHFLGRRRRHAAAAPVPGPGTAGRRLRRGDPAGRAFFPAVAVDGGHAPVAAGRRRVLGRRGLGQRLPRPDRGGPRARAHRGHAVHRGLPVDARRHAAPRPGLHPRRHRVRRAARRAPRLRLLAEPLRRPTGRDRGDDPAGRRGADDRRRADGDRDRRRGRPDPPARLRQRRGAAPGPRRGAAVRARGARVPRRGAPPAGPPAPDRERRAGVSRGRGRRLPGVAVPRRHRREHPDVAAGRHAGHARPQGARSHRGAARADGAALRARAGGESVAGADRARPRARGAPAGLVADAARRPGPVAAEVALAVVLARCRAISRRSRSR